MMFTSNKTVLSEVRKVLIKLLVITEIKFYLNKTFYLKSLLLTKIIFINVLTNETDMFKMFQAR